MAKTKYNLHLKGYVGGWDFDSDYVDFVLNKNTDKEVAVLIDSLGGQLNTALSISSAFRRHGNVHVHFVGMNASAATIASMGAKRITMDHSAMYLVHQCSQSFFEWGSLNATDMQNLIDNLEKQKSDLDKLDANVAEMYAGRCKKKSVDLLELMKMGGWLTAQEALAWGFVDELTEFDDESAPVLTEAIAADFTAHGIPLPKMLTDTKSEDITAFRRFLQACASVFHSQEKPNKIVPTISSEEKMKKTLTALDSDYGTIRAGRANPHVLDRITVDYYGTPTPLQQVANISVPEARMIQIQPWEASLVKEIEKAIMMSDLGINPSDDGRVIRLVFPELTEDRRKELVKEVKKKAEGAKVAIRNIRRDANDAFKKLAKEDVSEDEIKELEEQTQKLTDKYIKEVDQMVDVKSKEIMTV